MPSLQLGKLASCIVFIIVVFFAAYPSGICYADSLLAGTMNLYNIHDLPYLAFSNEETISIGRIEVFSPVQATWTRAVYLPDNKMAVLIWDDFSHYLIAWFCELHRNEYRILGSDRIVFESEDIANGPSSLEPPLLPPNNLTTDDTLHTQIICLDRPLAELNYFTIDGNTHEIALERTDSLGFYGGTPSHSFYLSGDSLGNGSGIGYWRPIFSFWEWLPDNPDDPFHFFRDYEHVNHKIIIGRTVPYADGAECLRFLVYHRFGASIKRFHSGYGYPTGSNIHPVEETSITFEDCLFGSYFIGANRSNEAYFMRDHRDYPIEIDREGRIWFAGFEYNKISTIPDASLERTIRATNTLKSIEVLTLPVTTEEVFFEIGHIDGSVAGQLTLTFATGIQTFRIEE